MGVEDCPDFDFPQPLINYDEEEAKEQSDEPTAVVKEENESLDEEDHETEDALAIGLNESVQRLEAKCADVREELGRMALREQYMRTKQAQLRARRKEMEAKEAILRAEKRELEAAEMRKKVGNMMRLLTERKNKLKVTENVIDKKGVVVDNVNKILNQKKRKAQNVTKQKEELLAFNKKANA